MPCASVSEKPTRVKAANLNGGFRSVRRPASLVTTASGAREAASARHNGMVSQTIEAPVRVREPEQDETEDVDRPWIVVVWNDPVNLMTYVTLVFQKLFGYSRAKAEKLMLQVHNEGKAVVSSGTREKAEYDVERLQAHGLWATMQRD